MSKTDVTAVLEHPVLPRYQVWVGNELVWFFSDSPAGSTVYDYVNDQHYRLTSIHLESGAFKAELVG